MRNAQKGTGSEVKNIDQKLLANCGEHFAVGAELTVQRGGICHVGRAFLKGQDDDDMGTPHT